MSNCATQTQLKRVAFGYEQKAKDLQTSCILQDKWTASVRVAKVLGYLMYVLTVANLKGGAGKTAVVTNLAIALSQAGRRVLLVDCDYQGDSTSAMGVELDDASQTVAQVLDRTTALSAATVKIDDALDLVPAAQDLEPLEERLGIGGCHEALLAVLQDASAIGQWDVAVLETRPDRKGMARAAAGLADLVFIPVNVQDGNSVKRAGDLVSLLTDPAELNEDVPIRILFNRASTTRTDGRLRNVEKAIRKAGLSEWADLVLPVAMPESAAFHAATVGALPLMYARPDSVPAGVFRAVAAEIMPFLTDPEA